jgi:two-component system, NtrC family, sensor kinase
MKNYSRALMLSLLALALISGLGFIYWKSQSYSPIEQLKITENLRAIEALDAEWNLDVFRFKEGTMTNYTKLTSPQEKLIQMQSLVNDELVKLNDAMVLKASADLKNMIDKKLVLVESFKSQSAILKNSLKFLPTAEAELQQLTAGEVFKSPSKKATLTALNELSNKLLSDTLKYNLAPTPELKTEIELGISYIDSIKVDYSPDVLEQTEILLAHAQKIIQGKEQEASTLKALAVLEARGLTQTIDQTLSAESSGQQQQQRNYRNYLFIYAALLLAILGYVGYKLLQSLRATNAANVSLNNVNSTLEEQVHHRTQMIEHAMDQLKESQVQLVQAEKMSSLGQMVAGVTHEINTPLAYVKSGLEISRMRVQEMAELIKETVLLNGMLQNGTADETELAQKLQRIGEISTELADTDLSHELDNLMKDGLHGIEQISEIVVGLKNFSRMDREKISQISVHEGLDNTLKIARNIVKYKKIIKQYGDIPNITCSPSSLNQVFLNLISNAAQATGEDGEIRITTSQLGDKIKIEISDNGSGIPDDVMKKIFDPFFTTKKIGEGTGLGLSIVQRIINEHDGEISVASRVGMGTKFTILLPIEMQLIAQATFEE